MSSISAFLSKRKVKRFKQDEMEQQNLSIHEQMCEFLTTNGDTYFLPYLNKFEKATLSQGKTPLQLFTSNSSLLLLSAVSSSLNATVSSQQLFSTIVGAIKDVEEKSKSGQRQSIKDMRGRGKAQAAAGQESERAPVTSSRQIPMHARLQAA